MKNTPLENFLINLGLLEVFEKYGRDFYSKPSFEVFITTYKNHKNAIRSAFAWENTLEGRFFWEAVSSEWESYLKTTLYENTKTRKVSNKQKLVGKI